MVCVLACVLVRFTTLFVCLRLTAGLLASHGTSVKPIMMPVQDLRCSLCIIVPQGSMVLDL